MYCYVSCIPYIGYGITIFSKLSPTPSDYHYSCLLKLARYICIIRDWGISYKRRGTLPDLPEPKLHLIVWEENIPEPKQGIDKGELMCFVENVYRNKHTNWISTTELALYSLEVQLFTGLKLNLSMY